MSKFISIRGTANAMFRLHQDFKNLNDKIMDAVDRNPNKEDESLPEMQRIASIPSITTEARALIDAAMRVQRGECSLEDALAGLPEST